MADNVSFPVFPADVDVSSCASPKRGGERHRQIVCAGVGQRWTGGQEEAAETCKGRTAKKGGGLHRTGFCRAGDSRIRAVIRPESAMENQQGTCDRRLLDDLAEAQQRGITGHYQKEYKYGHGDVDGRSSPLAHQYGASGRWVCTRHNSCKLPRLRPKRGSVCATTGILGVGIKQQP